MTKEQKEMFEEFVLRAEQGHIKVIFGATVNRAGSVFVHSLFDNHPNILSFPGPYTLYCGFFNTIRNSPNEWKKKVRHSLERGLLTSETSHNLGPNQNQDLDISVDRMVEYLAELVPIPHRDRRRFFLAIQFAAGIELKRDISKINIIYAHEHDVHCFNQEFIDTVSQDFKDFIILASIRDPRSMYDSYLKSTEKEFKDPACEHLKYDRDGFVLFYCWHSYLNALKAIERNPSRYWVIRLEDIQNEKEKYVRSLAAKIGVPFYPTLLESTFGGLLWHGDSHGTKQAGFRSNSNIRQWKSRLSPLHIAIIENLMLQPMKALQYEPIYPKMTIWWCAAWLLFPFWSWDDFKKFLQLEYYLYVKRVRGTHWIKVVLRGVRMYFQVQVKTLRTLNRLRTPYNKIPIMKTLEN